MGNSLSRSLVVLTLLAGSTEAQTTPPPLPLGIVFASDSSQPLIAQPPPAIAPPQTNSITDRDYLLSMIAERDRQYSQRFDAQEKAVAAALLAAKEAIAKAEAASEKRFDSVNEFRAQLKDQQATFLPRGEYFSAHRLLEDEMKSVRNTQVPRSEHETRWTADEKQLKAIQERLETLAARQYREAGASEGQSWLWGVIVGGAGLLIAAAVLVMNLFRRQESTKSRA